VRVRCDHCADERLVAFSCKTRGFCPSCTSRRMAGTAAHLVDRVRPAVPYRPWVLSLPRHVRFLIARDSDLLTRVLGVSLRKVFAWQRRRARAYGIDDPQCGAVTFVQRFGSLLNLNCHAHALLPDGVFAAEPDGAVSFHPLPAVGGRCRPPARSDRTRDPPPRPAPRPTPLPAHHLPATPRLQSPGTGPHSSMATRSTLIAQKLDRREGELGATVA
jgi:hypothetical protein